MVESNSLLNCRRGNSTEGSNPSLSASSPSPRNPPITMASSPDESLDHLTAKLAQLFESSSVVKREFVIIKSQ